MEIEKMEKKIRRMIVDVDIVINLNEREQMGAVFIDIRQDESGKMVVAGFYSNLEIPGGRNSESVYKNKFYIPVSDLVVRRDQFWYVGKNKKLITANRTPPWLR